MTKLEMARRAWKHGKHFVKKNLPMILSVGAGIGTAVTVVMAVKEAPKAAERVKEKEKIDPNMTVPEKIVVGGQQMPATIMAFLITEGLIFASTGSWMKRVAGFSVLYSAAVADKESKDKVLKAAEKLIGKDMMDEFKKQVGITEPISAKDAEDMINNPEQIEGKNEIRRCELALTGQIFDASYNDLVRGLEYSRRRIKPNDYGSLRDLNDYMALNDICIKIKCPTSDIGDQIGYAAGDDFRWSIVPENIKGAAGWKVYIYPDPKDSFDRFDD